MKKLLVMLLVIAMSVTMIGAVAETKIGVSIMELTAYTWYLGVIQGCEKALDDPAPFVAPVGPVPGGLEYTVRVWCNSADYWDVHFDLMKRIPTAIGAAGFAGPAPATKVVIDK